MIETDYFHHITKLMWHRKQQHMSTQELAKLSGLSKELIEAHEEQGYWKATFSVVSKITKALGLEVVFVDSDK